MPRAPLLLLILAALVAAPVGARNFQPPVEWSASGAVTVDTPTGNLNAGFNLARTGDGGLLWLGHPSDASTLALRAMLRPGQPASVDQFGDASAAFALTPLRILAAADSMALLRATEVGRPTPPERGVLVAIDLLEGGVRWAVPLSVVGAVVLDGGAALVHDAGHLLRLDPDGAPRWATALSDLFVRQERTEIEALHAVDGRAVLLVSRESPFGAALPLRIHALGLADGAQAWRAEASVPAGFSACASAVVGGALVLALKGPTGLESGLATIVVERRSTIDGRLLARTDLAQVPGDDTLCALADVDGAVAVATDDDQGRATLSLVEGSGALRWRADIAIGNGLDIARIPGSPDIASVRSAPNGNGLRIERWRGSDGGVAWGVDHTPPDGPGGRLLTASAEAIHLAASTHSGVAWVDFAPASGQVVANRNVSPLLRRVLPHTAGFIDRIGFDAAILADGSVRVRRLAATPGAAGTWTREVAGPSMAGLRPLSVTIDPVGSSRLLVGAVHDYTVDFESRINLVESMLDRETGALLWRRETASLRPGVSGAIAAADPGVFDEFTVCPPIGSCLPVPQGTRLSASADGSTVWTRDFSPVRGTFAAGDLLLMTVGPGNQRNWRLLDGGTGADRWSQAFSLPYGVLDLEVLPAGGFIASLGTTVGGVPVVDVERRSLDGGGLLWALRAGLAGDNVRGAVMRRASNGMPLLAANLLVSGTGFDAPVRPLLQLLDVEAGTASLTLRPALTGDRWWSLRPVHAESASTTRQPLQSLRYLEPPSALGSASRNSRVALATLDLATGTLGGENLVERRFDAVLEGPTGVELLEVLPGGAILASDLRLGADGLRRRSLLRLGAPAAGGGDLRLRLLDAELEPTGLGPSRRIRVEIDNVGDVPATNAVFGMARQGEGDTAHLVFAACSVVAGSGECPAEPVQRRVSLAPGATLRLEWEAFDPGYRGAPRTGTATLGGARIFIDAPWGYADTEPGNNVVEFALRLGAFGDDFE